MKKKTERKPKKENKSSGQHWSAFDEGIWGPTRIKALLDEFKQAIENEEVLSIPAFCALKEIDIRDFFFFKKKYPWFKRGLEILKSLIYKKRSEILEVDPDRDILREGLKNYDTFASYEREKIKHQEEKRKAHFTKDIASFNNTLAKDLATHNSNLKKGENNEWHEMLIKNVMLDSEGNAFLKFGGPRLTEEQCPTTVSPISTTSDQTGTNNES